MREGMTEHNSPNSVETGNGVPIVVVGVTTYQGDGNAGYRAKWHRAESWRVMRQAKCL